MFGALLLAALTFAPVALAAAAPPTPATPTAATPNDCDIIKHVNESVAVKERWVSVDGRRRAVVVEWRSEAEHAAAALLAAALRLAGYRSTRLRFNDSSLLERSHALYNKSETIVVLAARWTPGDVWAEWLQAVGASLVPVTPRLHRRCPRASSCCTSTTIKKLYVAEEWKTFINRTQSKKSVVVVVDRATLRERIHRDDNETFTFLDVELWTDEPNVAVIGAAPVLPAPALAGALSVADGGLRRYSPEVWHLLSNFDPREADLRHLLTLDREHREDPSRAVCEWAATSADLRSRLRTWVDYMDITRYQHHAFVFLCNDTENDTLEEYRFLLKQLQEELNLNKNFHVILGPVFVDCYGGTGSIDKARRIITGWFHSMRFYRLIGAVGPGRIFSEDVASMAEDQNFSLMAYSAVGPQMVSAAGGRRVAGGGLVRALRDLLVACRWVRLVVLSERERAASDLSAALRAAGDLNLKDVSLASDRTAIRDVLLSLRSLDARIFLVNGGARLAGEVMRVATDLGLTRAGRIWLTREWVGVDGGVDNVALYELTFAWRGGDARAAHVVGASTNSSLWDALQAHWAQRGAWPLYAAPLADAVLALGKGYHHIFRDHQNFYDDIHSYDAFSTFWKVTETEAISGSGVVQELRFKERELRSPRVFLYRWRGDRAALASTWLVGSRGAECPRGAPVDGSVTCFVHVGDRFEQKCGDVWLVAALVAVTALAPFLLVAALAARRALRARDAHLVKRAEEMLEARWRAKSSRFEPPSFIKRGALELREQIGAGRFGRVFLCFLREQRTRAGAGGAVAAKALREDAAPVEETEFFREARALASLQHEHVVRFVGVCVTGGPPLLLMEYAFFGDLLRYVRARRHLVGSDSPEAARVSAEALTRFARQAAAALAYLVRRGFVHRDVRAANCLVDERHSLKLADFGMARATRPADGAGDADGDGEYTSRRRALFPVLWMAPESLSRGVFSAASDVWALGVLALELVTLGARPYGDLSPLRVHHYVVREGRRPPLPRELGAEARALLLACWRRAADARPAADALAAWLAARPRALAPVPPAAKDRAGTGAGAEDVDSGIGEPRAPRSAALPHSFCFDDISLYDDDASFS